MQQTRKGWRRVALLLTVSILLAGCASTARWPAITGSPTQAHQPGRWVWVELLTADLETSRNFYSAVFGWDIQSAGSAFGYALARADGVPVAGLLYSPKAASDGRSARWLGLMSVDDVGLAASFVRDNGGEVLIEPRRLAGRGTVALLADPEGARFGVIRSAGGDPADDFPPPGAWLWHELWAVNGEAMADFYATIGAYTVSGPQADEQPPERHLEVAGYPRAGIIEVPRDARPSAWLHYVRVADLGATLTRVQDAGGRVLIEPAPAIRDGRVAIIVDSLGAPLGVAEWPEPHNGGTQP